MRKFITSVSICLLCSMMLCPNIDANERGRNNGSKNTTKTETRQKSNNNSAKRDVAPTNTNRGRQQSQPKNSGKDNRPAQSTNNVTPNNNKGRDKNVGDNRGRQQQQARPNNNGVRPNNNSMRPNNNSMRPRNDGAGTRVGRPRNDRPMNRNVAPSRPKDYGHGAPARPYMPANRVWHRPIAPANYHTYVGCPSFSTILGVALGSAINYSIDCLLGAGYTVLGYAADAVYLSNVPLFDYTWSNATLYYDNSCLQGSEFVYSSVTPDISRYNRIYRDLLNKYGDPLSVTRDGINESVTWWGDANRYVTLSYYYDLANDGTYRYFTTVSYGN